MVFQGLRLNRFFQLGGFTQSGFTGLYMTTRLLPLVFVPRACDGSRLLPFVRQPQRWRGTVLLLRIVKERVDFTVLFITYAVNTF